jgi:hypothetical protein
VVILVAGFLGLFPIRFAPGEHLSATENRQEDRFVEVFEITGWGFSMSELLSVDDVVMTYNRRLKLLTVKGSSEALETVRNIVERLNAPPKSVELTAYFLMTSESTGGEEEVPPDEQPTHSDLRRPSGEPGQSHRDRLVLRTAETTSEGAIQGGPYVLNVGGVAVVREQGSTLLRMQYVAAGVETDPDPKAKANIKHQLRLRQTDIPIGKEVPLGEIEIDSSGSKAVVWISAKVLNER